MVITEEGNVWFGFDKEWLNTVALLLPKDPTATGTYEERKIFCSDRVVLFEILLPDAKVF